jgi:NAD+ kinase
MRTLRRVGLVIYPTHDARLIGERVEALLNEHGIVCVAAAPVVPDLDAVIVLGGDGLLMHTACDYAPYECPVLGINLGHLGFLTATERPQALAAVTALLEGEYRIEERMMLEARVESLAAGQVMLALNDIVFNSGTRMASFDVRIASQALSFRGDGLIVATSTGSTAYNASAFGPIIDPAIDCLIVNIRYPQPLPFPPMVVHPSRELEVALTGGAAVLLSPDGRTDLPLAPRERVAIGASRLRAKLVRLPHNDFFETLNHKFNLPLRTAIVARR